MYTVWMGSDEFRLSDGFSKAINEQLDQTNIDRVVILPASRYSIEQLTEAYNAARVDYVIPMPMSPPQFIEYIKVYDLNLSASCVMVDTFMSQIVGLGLLGVRSGRCWITRFGIVPQFRQSGIGRMIIEQLIQAARQYGAHEITMEMIDTDHEGIARAEALGFVATSKLIIGRRPPETTLHGAASKLEGVTHVQGEEALNWLRERSDQFDWHNDWETYQHVTERLEGIEFKRMREDDLVIHGRVIFEDRKLQLSRITVQVFRGDLIDVTQGMLNLLHVLYPRRDARVENIPSDDLQWEGYLSSGYFKSFCRIEYVKMLD